MLESARLREHFAAWDAEIRGAGKFGDAGT